MEKREQIKHIYFFSSYNIECISARYRGLYVLQNLKKDYGINYSFVYPGYSYKEIVHFIRIYFEVMLFRKNHSLIIYQKLHSFGIYTVALRILLKLRSSKTIYDTDDADYLRFDEKVINKFIKHSDLCIVGSQALKEYSSIFNSNVLLLSSPVIVHNEIKNNRNRVLNIGWVGHFGTGVGNSISFAHSVSLYEILFPALLELDFLFKLTILGVKKNTDKENIERLFSKKNNIVLDIPLEIDWLNEEGIYNLISKFDIGLSPMINHEFNIAKSAFKAKQYLSCGVPVLGSPVGENLNFIKHEKNGFLCKSKQDFKDRIIEFKDMSNDQYECFHKAALADREEFSMNLYCKKFIENINDPT